MGPVNRSFIRQLHIEFTTKCILNDKPTWIAFIRCCELRLVDELQTNKYGSMPEIRAFAHLGRIISRHSGGMLTLFVIVRVYHRFNTT